MHELFELLKSKGLVSRRLIKTVFSLKDEEIRKVLEDAISIILKQTKRDQDSSFSFVANGTLSGSSFPCRELTCRIQNIDTLARNAILYADTVFITNPFEDYLYYSSFPERIRACLAEDLIIIYHVQPLIEAGIIKFTSSFFHVCKPCLKAAKVLTRTYERKINLIEERLFEMALTDFTYTVGNNSDSSPFVEVNGSPDILEHPIRFTFFDEGARKILKKSKGKRKHILSAEQLIELEMPEMVIGPIVNDLVAQSYYTKVLKSSYLTNRQIDSDLININHKKSEVGFRNTLSKSLDHHVPFLPQADLKKLIRLRRNEGEAFEIYRSSFFKVLNNLPNNSGRNIIEAFKDEVQPEILKMNQAIKNSRKLILSDITKDLVVGSTFISVGLFSNILPANIGQIIAGVGGINYLGKFGDNIKKLSTVETEVKSNKYYFVWKLMKQK